MPNFKYDPIMTTGEHGRRLYPAWKRIKGKTDAPEFKEYPGFYKWAMENGYTIGAMLYRRNPDGPYSSENCFWVSRSTKTAEEKRVSRDEEWEKLWDDTVNRIRRHYGMDPIYSPEV